MQRAAALAIAGVLVGAVLEPLTRKPYDDDFPLSTYPMFATYRKQKMTFSYPIGVLADGTTRSLSPRMVGSGEILQAVSIVEDAVGHGKPAMDDVCKAIAGRVAKSPRFANVTEIRIVTATHDIVDYLVSGARGREIVRDKCAVIR
ncbi:MAG TPA: hypothetical protein VGM88_15615 [Kofleriaceae bacterium]|jgi:hypothetical protein